MWFRIGKRVGLSGSVAFVVDRRSFFIVKEFKCLRYRLVFVIVILCKYHM